jgi:hypothetical protein
VPNAVDPEGWSRRLATSFNEGICWSSGCRIIPVPGGFIIDCSEVFPLDYPSFPFDLNLNIWETHTSSVDMDVQTDIDVSTDSDRLWGCKIPEDTRLEVVSRRIEAEIAAVFQSIYGYEYTSYNAPLIPRAHRSGDGRNGIPDLVLRWDLITENFYTPVEIYEIKPISWGPEGNISNNVRGRRQLRRYVDNFWLTGLAFSAEAGVTWNPDRWRLPYPFDPSQYVVLYTYYSWYHGSPEAGMIYYACEDI